jgi:dephospho-CoA kinase
LRKDPEVRRQLERRFGQGVIGDDGADRARLAEIVFNDAEQLEWLEELLHPRVARENLRWREEVAAQADPPQLTATEVPLLYETGAEQRFDAVVVITAPADVRRSRRPPADDREQRLLPEEQKLRFADFSYVNDGSLEELDAFVAGVIEQLTR